VTPGQRPGDHWNDEFAEDDDLDQNDYNDGDFADTPGSAGWARGFVPYSRPRPVENGLVARSTRGGIGEQWWSRRFIEVLESFALGTRLTRGRAYARKGQVRSLSVTPGEVIAVVQGSRVTPYRVRIGLPVFRRLIWAKAEVVLAEQAIHSARLLAGEFPPELEPVLAGIGAPLFPARLSDLKLICSCPDHAVPCKHIAAVFYLLAEQFDDDPFLILLWRGRGREELLKQLRELRGDGDDGAADPVEQPADHRQIGAAAVLVLDRAGQVSPDPLTFWTAGEVRPLPSHPELPVDLLLRSLPVPGAALGGARLLGQLAPLYPRLSGGTPDTAKRSGHGNLGE
jgi:uncharacterized Zn finger protein